MNKLFYRIKEGIYDACYIWMQEMRTMFKDEGVLMFFIVVPIAYPILYSWIYNNEVVREVPVVVVDNCNSGLSREFIRKCDASPDVKIAGYAPNLELAKEMVGKQKANGVYYIPSDFDVKLNRMEQTSISVYCDMSLMLAYKAIYQTAVAVSGEMNARMQIKLSGKYTAREDEILVQPLAYTDVPIFNPAQGYGSFVLPAVLMLIIQQTLLLGIGLSAGTARENHRYKDLIPISRHYQGIFRIVFGKSMAYFMIYAVLAAYLALAVPYIFNFVTIGLARDLVGILFPYILASIFFGMTVSCMVSYRENVMLLVVFSSVPLLFLSGVSWPESNIHWFWESISWLFPSTYGIRAYVRVNSMGANLEDILPEYRALWIQTAFYFFAACLVYRHQIIQSRQHALERLEYMKKKRAVRKRLKLNAAKK